MILNRHCHPFARSRRMRSRGRRRSGGDAQWTTLRRASWPVFSARAAQLSRARGVSFERSGFLTHAVKGYFGLGISIPTTSRCLGSGPPSTARAIDRQRYRGLAQLSSVQLSSVRTQLGAHTAQYPLAAQHTAQCSSAHISVQLSDLGWADALREATTLWEATQRLWRPRALTLWEATTLWEAAQAYLDLQTKVSGPASAPSPIGA